MTIFSRSHTARRTGSPGAEQDAAPPTAASSAAAAAAAVVAPVADETSEERRTGRRGVLSLAHITRRGGSTPRTPPATPPLPLEGASQGDVHPSRLSQFSLRLNELVNKAFVASSSARDTAPAPSATAAHFATPGMSAAQVPRLQSVTYGGKHLPDRGRVVEITLLVVQELHFAARVDAYLLRAVSRSVLKSLSQFVARIESLLIPVSQDASAVVIPASSRAVSHLPPAMEFNLGLMSLEWIVEESLERCLEGLPPLVLPGTSPNSVATAPESAAQPAMPTFVHEILSPLREQMGASILHVVQPILANLRSSFSGCMHRANAAPFVTRGVPAVLDGRAPGTAEMPADAAAYGRPPGAHAPWLRELEERLDVAHRLLVPRIADRCGLDGLAWFVSVAIHVVWKALLAITSRSVLSPADVVEAQLTAANAGRTGAAPSSTTLTALLAGESSKRVPTPAGLANALRTSIARPAPHKRRQGSGDSTPGMQTPPGALTPTESDNWLASLLVAHDEPNAYVVNPLLVAEQVCDLQAVERLMHDFCAHLQEPDSTAHRAARRSSATDEEGEAEGERDEEDDEDLALAALHEALDALQSTTTLVRTLLREPDALAQLSALALGRVQPESTHLSAEAVRAFDVVPTLLLLHLALCRLPPRASPRDDTVPTPLLPTPPELFRYTWAQYDAALVGFASGESAAQALVQRYAPLLSATREDLERRCAMAEHDEALLAAADPAHVGGPPADEAPRRSGDASSERSSSPSAEGETPASMVHSAPTLDQLRGAREPGEADGVSQSVAGLNLESAGGERGARPAGAAGRSAAPLAQRFWRRSPSQRRGGSLGIPNALPPRVSRAHATGSPHAAERGSRRSSPHLARSGTVSSQRRYALSVAQIQRDALGTFAGVLERAQRTFE